MILSQYKEVLVMELVGRTRHCLGLMPKQLMYWLRGERLGRLSRLVEILWLARHRQLMGT